MSKDTCYEPQRHLWSDGNASLGQCYVTTLIVHDFFGGKIMKAKSSNGISHYWNRINGKDIDLTRDQFPTNERFTDEQVLERVNLLDNKRYKELKRRVRLLK